MSDWHIDTIQALNDLEAQEMSQHIMRIKDHIVYFVDFGGHFGYSALVFMDNRHIYYANEYELHYTHMNYSRAELHQRFVEKLNGKLFTEREITGPVKDYDEYKRKVYFLHNYYGMRREHLSIFACNPSDAEREAFALRTKNMHYDPVSFAYYDDVDFVVRHITLQNALEKAWAERENDFDVLKSAFIYEMYNHEYEINWQADFDVLSVWGIITYHDGDLAEELQSYFDQLKFNDTQRRAYLAARKEYLRLVNESGD